MQREHPAIPILILSGLEDKELAVRTVQDGAQDFLMKGNINSTTLSRTIRYAIERKRSEERLKASEVSYRRLFETTQDGIFILDAKTGQITDANPCLEKLLGYTLSEFIGKRLWEIAPFRDKKANQAAFATLIKIGHIVYSDLPLASKSGQFIDVEFVSNVYTVGNRQVIQCNIRDITERKRAEDTVRASEELNRSILESSTDCIKLLDMDEGVLSMNGPGLCLMEVDDFGLIEGQNWGGFWKGEAADLARAAVDAAKAGGSGRFQGYCPTFKGTPKWWDVTVTPILNEQGQPVRLVSNSRDVTESKQAEQELLESRARFESIVANVPGVVYQYILHPDGSAEVPFVNEACRELFGMEPEEIQRSPYFPTNLIHPDDRAESERSIAESAANLSPWIWEGRFQFPTGETKWIQAASHPRRLPDGGTLWDGLLLDITARKEAEEERDRFFTMSLDMLCIADHNGYFKRLNPAFEKTLGFSNAELMAKPFLEWVHPDDIKATVAVMQDLDGASALHFANRYRCRDGSYRWLSWVSAPYEGLIYAAAHDVTSLKNAEAALQKANDELELNVIERTAELSRANEQLQLEMIERQSAEESLYKNHEFLQAVLENTAEGIVACDAGGQLTFFNRATREFHGLLLEPLPSDQWPEYYSLYLSDGITPIQQEDVPLLRALRNDPVRNEERVIVPREGSVRSVIVNGEPLFDAEGGKLGAVVVMHDITEWKQAEVELQRAKQEADAANHAKSEFLSRMSHELRTPLNAVLGFGQLLEMSSWLDDGDIEAVGHILKGGRHLLGLINEVLDIASIEAGRISLSPEPILFSKTIHDVLDMVRPLAATRRIQIVNEVAEHDARHVRADQQRFRQVLLNLLANAIKYNCDGGRVAVSCAASGRFLRFMVSDTGSGLTTEEVGKLFVPFERLGAAKSQVEGTGLGLVLCKRLVEAMEGRIGVDSVPSQGSTFWVEFPLVESQSAQLKTRLARSQDQIASSDGPDASLPQAVQRTVLYIEDNLSNFEVIERLLAKRPQIKLLSAMQGSIGLDLACQHLPDLILLDLHLPDIPGDVVLHRLRADSATREIPVVVLSADATSAQIDKLRAAGIEHYLTKPIDLRQFLLVLDEILNKEGT